MAKCPNVGCDKTILWDWRCDCAVYEDGVPLRELTLHPTIQSLPIRTVEITASFCECGTPICVEMLGDYGLLVFAHPQHENVEWEEPENYFNGKLYDEGSM